MAAPAGNDYAKGSNGGGHGVSRSMVSYFKKKVIEEMLLILDGDDEKAKRELILKMGPHCIPKDMDITSGGKPIVLPAEIIAKHAIDTSAEGDSDGQA